VKYPTTYESTVTDWRRRMADDHLAPRTISFYVETMHAVAQILKDNNRPVLPREITAKDVEFLLDYLAANNYAIQTRKGYLATIRKFCDTYQNTLTLKKPRFPHDNRPRVDWLDSEQAKRLLSCPKSTVQTTVIHLELCLGLRHVEVIRLRADDINYKDEYITVLGKGPSGGKPRLIPFASDTRAVLEAQERHRRDQIDMALSKYPKTTIVPPNLVLWLRGGKLHSYSEEGYGLDKIVTLPLSDVVGFHFSNHTLRRTFGRALYRSGVEVAVIAKILGHESTDVTLRYIGVDLDDMTKAMRRLNYD